MLGQLVRAITTVVALLLGVVAGAWLSLAAAYMWVEPAERSASNVLLVSVLVALLVGLAFLSRKASGPVGLAAFSFVVFLGFVGAGVMMS